MTKRILPGVLPTLLLLATPPHLHAASDITVTAAVTAGGAFTGTNPQSFIPSAAAANIQSSSLQTLFNAGTGVVIDSSSGFAGNGDINLSVALAKNAGGASTLSLNATRDVTMGGTFTASGAGNSMPLTLAAGRNISITQSLNTNGGSMTLSPASELALGSTLNSGAGTITLQSGLLRSTSGASISSTGGMTVANGSSLRFQGTITAPLTVAGSVSSGTPGAAGSLQVTGPLTLQAGSTVVTELGGTTAGSNHDKITATGTVSIAGALQVDFIGSFHDSVAGGTTFTILQGSSISGTFTGLPNGSRFVLPNERGSFRINYTATTVTLDDWQPVMTTLTWDPGMEEAGTHIVSNTSTRAGRHYFKVTTQSSDLGGWRTRLVVTSGEATLHLQKNTLPNTSTYTHRSNQIGSDGIVLRDDQFNANEEWYLMVYAEEGAQWSIVSGKPYVHDLGTLPFNDANSNGQYDTGETSSPQASAAAPMPPEGIRFYKTTIPNGTAAWSLWLGGSPREIALRSNKLPFHNSSTNYTRKQAAQMLCVPPVLNTSGTWYSSVVAPMGEVIGLDSRLQEVSTLAYNGTVNNVTVSGAPYRVYRVQVPVDQIAWDINADAISGNPNICVRKGSAPAEFDNEAFSASPGTATEGITLVPNYLTDGTWYITVWGDAAYGFSLKNGDPVITPLSFTDLKVNDQPARSGWRFYVLNNIPSQVGALGWELELSNQMPGTQIALRRNKVPGRWQKRDAGSTSVTDTNTTHMDESSTNGFLQRVNHQADVWYVGIFTPQQPLGAFTLDVHPMTPAVVAPQSATAVNGIPPQKWRFFRMDIPADMEGWDLRLANSSGGNCALVVRRDRLPSGTTSTSGSSGWNPSVDTTWTTGNQWAAGTDWTDRLYDLPASPRRDINDRIVAAGGRPLVAGTYYIGIYNDGSDPITGASNQPASMTLESRRIGTGGTFPVTTIPFTPGSTATANGLVPREAAFYKITVPPNTPNWEFTLTATAGESLLAIRRDAIPDNLVATNGNLQGTTSSSRQAKLQRTGSERYLLLPENNEDFILPGDYHLAIVGEGTNPPASNVIGTGTSSATFTNLGTHPVQDLGAANASGITSAISLAGMQVKSYRFTVPADTASLEVRLDNRVGNPMMALISGTRIPQPDTSSLDIGTGGGQTTAPTGGVSRRTDDDLITIANPPAGTYTITVRADEVSGNYPDASANLVIVANSPVPLAFNNGTATVTGQAPTAWRYFQVTVPDGIMGWDIRLANITSGNPQMVVRRDLLPSSVGTTNGGSSGWNPSADAIWTTGYQWAGSTDWTGRTHDVPNNPRRPVGDRIVAAANRPLVPGTYIVGIYSEGKDSMTGVANTPASYTIESRGIGEGQAITIGEIPFTPGASVAANNLVSREAAYYKITVPANTPRWEFTLDATVGEAMLAVRRAAIPDFNAVYNGNVSDSGTTRQVKLQRGGGERYTLLPENNSDFITAGDYYLAIVGEGLNPPSSTVLGTGSSSATFTNLGTPGVQDLGEVSPAGITQAVTLAGAQVKAYRFTLPAGAASMEVRLNNRVGNPQMAFMSGLRVPQPDGSAYDYGTGGGQTTTLSGGLSRQTSGTLVNVVSPPAGTYTLTVRADEGSTNVWPDASADLVIVTTAPETLPIAGGTVDITNHASGTWKFFQVTIPSGIAGWDIRLKNLSGGNPSMVVRRNLLPSSVGTTDGGSSGWNPSAGSTWPTGYQWAADKDWTGRTYDSTAAKKHSVNDRIVAAMGRPLEPGTYFIGIQNDGADPITSLSGQPANYTIESRFIGDGQTIPIATLGFAAGSSVDVNSLTPREAAYYKVMVPANTPSWEFTLTPGSGEMLMVARRGFIPDCTAVVAGDLQGDGTRQAKVQKAGAERYQLLPPNNQDFLTAGDYYIAVVSEGNTPPNDVIGTGTSSGVLASLGSHVITQLGSASLTPINRAITLAGAQVKGYQFTVPEGVVSLEVQLNNRTGNPRMALISGNRLPFPDTSSNEFGTGGGQSSTPAGGSARIIADSLITVPNPPAGVYSLTVRADDLSSAYPDATGDLVIVARPRTAMNFASSLNGNGLSHTDTRTLADGQKQFYEVQVPATLSGQPVLGWLLKVNHGQGDTTLRVYKQWGNPGAGVSITANTGLIVPPFLTFNETWFIEVTATGTTQYTLTSQPVATERPAWQMAAGHNFTFGDSGNDSGGNPLPGDRGVDIGQDDWHFYAIDVPNGNSGLLRTQLNAISGNPDLYIREDGVPTTDHDSNGGETGGAGLVDRKMEDTGSEYGNWVPFDGQLERQLKPGRWYLGVKAKGGSNARYRLMASTGQVADLNLATASASNQTLVGRDWRYYRFTVPADAPATWSPGFTQQVGDVVMWIRDTVPPGQNSGTGNANSAIESWSSDAKNQGPYDAAGQDAPAIYPFNTPPLRPGHTYYAGFRANTDATFSVTSSSTGSAPAATPVSFYNGIIDTTVAAGSNVLYKIVAPNDGTRLKWTSTHPATVQIRTEQGTFPGLTGGQHNNSSGTNSVLNKPLALNTWPWQPGQTYYLRIVNSGATTASVLVNISGQNSGTEDEDNDGLLDSWELTYYTPVTKYNATDDPDLDGVTNSVEQTDGTNPVDINSAKYFLTVNANFGSVSKSPDQPKYDRNTVVTLTPTPNSGLIFTGWTGTTASIADPLALTMQANHSLTANFGTSLPVALDTTLGFTTGGAGIWTGQIVTSRDGTDAAQSAPITHNQETWMQANVSGPGVLEFWWKVSSGSGDYLEFHIDGALQTGRINGTVDWAKKTYNITAGQHTLRWRYVKDGSISTGSDAGWVDQLVWTSTGGYNNWLTGYFTGGEIANPLVTGPNMDPDKDGISNLVEYAMGGHPKNADGTLGALVPSVVKVGGANRVRVDFTLPEQIPADVVYQLQISDNLATWTDIASQSNAGGWTGSATVDQGTAANGRRPIAITDAGTAPATSKRMVRLKVSLQ